MLYPTKNNRLTSKFGYRNLSRKQDYHSGNDFGCLNNKIPTNDIIQCISKGEVKRINNDVNGYGNYVVVEHELNNVVFCTLYAHLHEINVAVGQKLEEGQKVGLMGKTGGTSAIHLHFEVRECSYKDFWLRWQDITEDGNREPVHAIDPQYFFYIHIECYEVEISEDISDIIEENIRLKEKLDNAHKITEL